MKNTVHYYFWSFFNRSFQPFISLVYLCIAIPAAAAVIDVTTYGAIPNDSVDDSAAIQRAVDAAPNNSTIFFPRGTYLLAGVKINQRSGLILSGEGSTLSILKRNGNYPRIFESTGATDLVVTQLGFDANGIVAYGGFSFYDAKRITIAKNRFFDSQKRPVGAFDRYSWVFAHGSVPSEDILVRDNLIEDLQLEIDFGLRVRVEGNTVVRPVQTAGIGVFTINDNTAAQQYTIQNNTIIDPVVSAGGIVLHLDPPGSSYSTFKGFRIVDNRIVYTKLVAGKHASAIRLGTGDNSPATTGNVFDDILIQNNVIYKDPDGSYDFGNVHGIIFGNSSALANFKFTNLNVSNNLIYYNRTTAIKPVDVRQQGVNYVEANNLTLAISSDTMPPSVPTAVTAKDVSGTEIRLAWNPSFDNIGVSKYRIYRNGVGIGYSAAASFLDKNRKPRVAYTYTIAAIDLIGNQSSQSYSVTGRTPGIVPSGPTNLTIK